MLNSVLTDVTWGRVVDGVWTFVTDALSSIKPAPFVPDDEVTTFGNYLDYHKYPRCAVSPDALTDEAHRERVKQEYLLVVS